MFHSSKCPKCDMTISNVRAEVVEVKVGRSAYKGVSYYCPHAACHAVLSVQIDPLALNQQILNALGKG